MPWLHHPAYRSVRDALIEHLSSMMFVFKKTSLVVFVGGPAGAGRARDRLTAYLRTHRPGLLVFYAEHVWDEIAQMKGVNALEMEQKLANLADAVILIVDSPGTFAELGAFALSDRIRKKLLPILNRDYQSHPSFINTGPVRWVDLDSRFGPCIHVDLTTILASVDDITARLDLIHQPVTKGYSKIDIASGGKHLLLLLCDLVALVGPASADHISYFAGHMASKVDQQDIANLLALAVALGLVRKTVVEGVGVFYDQPQGVQAMHAAAATARNKRADFSWERARLLSAVQKLPAAQVVLAAIRS
jgi:hypothetical protein